MGIEPTQPAWKAGALPLSYTRITFKMLCRGSRSSTPKKLVEGGGLLRAVAPGVLPPATLVRPEHRPALRPCGAAASRRSNLLPANLSNLRFSSTPPSKPESTMAEPCPPRLQKLVEGGGFEPPKAEPADLQSAPFGHSGTPPRASRVLSSLGYTLSTRNRAQRLKFRAVRGDFGCQTGETRIVYAEKLTAVEIPVACSNTCHCLSIFINSTEKS
jgi:hypothetical protein